LHWERCEDKPFVDMTGARFVLPAGFVKSDEDQWVPLHPEMRKILEALPRTDAKVFPFISRTTGQALTRKGITGRIKKIAQRAGVRLSMHKLRKGFGCRAATQLGKGNAPVLHRLMRHSSMQLTMDYYANVDDVLSEVMAKLT
jgi:integrase